MTASTWRNNRHLPLLVTLVIALVMLFSPGSTVPSSPDNTDKITHALLFAALAMTSLYARIPAWLTVVWLVVFAGVSEVLQEVLPISRSGSIWDFGADASGIVLGLSIAALLSRRRARASAGPARRHSS